MTGTKLYQLKMCMQHDHPDAVPPIDVLWVHSDSGKNYYIAFGGCHRWEAHMRLNRRTIRAKLIRATPDMVKAYMGSATPRFD